MTFPSLVQVTVPVPVLRPSPNPGRQYLALWIEAWDGSKWLLDDAATSGITLMRGVRGLGAPEWESHDDRFASIAGSHWRDATALSREIFLPMHVFHDGTSADWVAHHDLFAAALSDPRKPVRLFCQSPDGTVRSIEMRYQKGLEEAYELDPAFFGWATYGVYFKAHQPFWEGLPVTRTWGSAEPVYFFGGGTEGPTLAPPFGIASPSLSSIVTVTNPGDEDTWPRWTLEGPIPVESGIAAKLGVGDRTVDVPFALASGEILVVDARPTEQSALLDGVDRTEDLATYGWSEIPAGRDVELNVQISGTGGTVRVELPTLYHRAFGKSRVAA